MSDIETARAINILTGRLARRPAYGCIGQRGGRVVYAGRPNLPYGASNRGQARLTHIPRAVFTAWRRGQLVGQKVAWRCGGESWHFALLDAPTYQLCRLCALYAGGLTVTVVIA